MHLPYLSIILCIPNARDLLSGSTYLNVATTLGMAAIKVNHMMKRHKIAKPTNLPHPRSHVSNVAVLFFSSTHLQSK